MSACLKGSLSEREIRLLESNDAVHRQKMNRLAKKAGVKAKGTNEQLRAALLQSVQRKHQEVTRVCLNIVSLRSEDGRKAISLTWKKEKLNNIILPEDTDRVVKVRFDAVSNAPQKRGRYSLVHQQSFEK